MPTPLVSIIIPTYARPVQLRACIASFLQLEFPRDQFEIIVVDDGSPTPLDAVIEPFKNDLAITLLRQKNRGPASARNNGATIARGTYIAFTDDDCAPSPQWLSVLTGILQQEDRCIVGGQIVNAVKRNIYSAASQSLVSYLYDYFNADPTRATFFTSNNFALRTDLFKAIGGFDTTYARAAAEDREFCDRWISLSRRMIHAPAAVIFHSHRMTLRQFIRQHWHYGCGAFRFHTIRARRKASPLRVEPFKFYLDLLTYPFREKEADHPIACSLLLFVSQAVNAMGFFWERKKQEVEIAATGLEPVTRGL